MTAMTAMTAMTTMTAMTAMTTMTAMTAMTATAPDVVLVPGNGCAPPVRSCNWYGWLERELQQKGFRVVLQDMPDPELAPRILWVPLLKSLAGPRTVVVGHSSGGEAALRLAEEHSVRGLVLVSPCVTDLGDPHERASGYFDGPWLWEEIRRRVGFVDVFGSRGDPFIPFAEQLEVARQCNAVMHELPHRRGHFMEPKFSELLQVVERRLAEVSVSRQPAAETADGDPCGTHGQLVAAGVRADVSVGASRSPGVSTGAGASRDGKRHSTFDWFLEFEALEPVLDRCFPAEDQRGVPRAAQAARPASGAARSSARAGVVGCGTSTLSARLRERGFGEVWSVDREPAVVSHMAELHPDLTWLVGDLSRDCSHLLPAGSFDLVVDKGTLDAMLCAGSAASEGDASEGDDGIAIGGRDGDNNGSVSGADHCASAGLLANVASMLAPEGCFLLVSLHPPSLLARLLSAPGINLTVDAMDCFLIQQGHGGPPARPRPLPLSTSAVERGSFTAMVCRRGASSVDIDIGNAAAAHQRILDDWFLETAPLLTASRRRELTSSWAQLCASRGLPADAGLSTSEAYLLMFTEVERSEYSFEYFLQDLIAGFRSTEGAAETKGESVENACRNEMGSLASGAPHDMVLDLPSAIRFLQENQ